MDDYQKQALKSIAITQKGIAALGHRTLGLNGEAGIIANQLKKAIRDNDGVLSDEDIAVLNKRLGDVLYYVAALADYIDTPLSEIAQHNIEQSTAFLKSRRNKE